MNRVAQLALAFAGDAAPGTGAGVFQDFIYPVSSAGGVAFLGAVSGGSATGGVFLAQSGIVPVAIEFGSAPGTGGATFVSVNAPPAIDDAGSVIVSAGLAGGSASGGVFVYDPGLASLAPALLAGDAVPGVSGAVLASFGQVAVNDTGEIAFVADLDDGRTGVFVASPAVEVPALSGGGAALTALIVAFAARRALRRGARARRA